MIYLNNAATSWPKAPGVIEAVTRSLDEPPVHPGRAASRFIDVLTECRQRLAGLLNIEDPARIILTVNATHALNLAIWGIRLDHKAHVITTVTEHNSVLRPLNHRRRELGFRLSIIGLDTKGDLDHEAFDRAMTQAPNLVVINHVSNVTGGTNNVVQLFEKAKSAGAVTLLDASQSLGHIPVDPAILHADIIAFTGHKNLLGPPGTGGLYVAPGLDLEQLWVGGTGVRSDLALHPKEMPTRLEAGTPNMPALAGLNAALRWLEDNGKAFRQRQEFLSSRLVKSILGIPTVKTWSKLTDHGNSGIISLRIEDWKVDEVGWALEESFGITCRTGLHCAPLIHQAIGSDPEGTVRLSLSGFNTIDDVELAAHAISQLSACVLSR